MFEPVDRPFDGVVRLGDAELIDRVPSEARADLLALADRQGARARVNWSGDLEVAAWGVSMGATQEQVLSPEGYLQGGDRVRTEALFVASELADDPYGTEPVIAWRDVRDESANPGAWPVRALEDRPSWGWIPLQSVGQLRFGMTPQQVAAALDGEVPAARRGHFPWPVYQESEQWYLTEDQFDGAGVTAHYWYEEGIPALGAVTVHGRTGPSSPSTASTSSAGPSARSTLLWNAAPRTTSLACSSGAAAISARTGSACTSGPPGPETR
ncbi:hypothetical protein GCM10017562_01380 [Streptomyces roseofulvus]|uniref:hypothetical protein n=1 Tax=Streptomyces roseofulvus TaxID=33902 RepID=UPI0031FCC1E2